MLQKNLRSDHAPKNLRSDHAPSKNKYDRVPPKMEHGHFSNYGGTLFLAKFQKHSFCYTSSFNTKGNQRVPLALPLSRIQSKPDSMKFILTQNLKNYQAPINLRSDHAPSKNKYDRFPQKCDKWNRVIFPIMVEPFSLVQKIGDKWK